MLPPFRLHRPTTVDEASEAVARLGDAAFFCGGTELLQVMKIGLARFEHLIDLKHVRELHGVALEADGWLRIGAAATHREIERSEVVARAHPGLAALERQVANVRVRTMGTLGGNLCFAEPHSDPATFLAAVGARLELATAQGRREVTVADFFQGALTTDRADDEVLVAVRVPPLGDRAAAAYRKFVIVERPTAGAACLLRLAADGTVEQAVVVVGALAEAPQPLPDAGRALQGATPSTWAEAVAEAGAAAERQADADDEPLFSAEYRRHIAGVLVRRAATAAIEEAFARA